MATMGGKPPTGLQIHATDVNPMFHAQLQANLTNKPSWSVKSQENGRLQPRLRRQHLRQRDEAMWDEALDSIVEELPRNEWDKVKGKICPNSYGIKALLF
ncbi:uncharacterized protein J4E78_009640 [Alternaria triticimaculans]|uniref:uncharacterized protein n=1 Tax=Alternaria triticimaculans TaxID=297637 RepID=UPI0020C2AE53|nr:uncharacterized protein J4E78_009640 [Alternaria triticimaculans]KAI4644057.1 hypothetical protein J4E78_009640 [Alternaria triticimaculans]